MIISQLELGPPVVEFTMAMKLCHSYALVVKIIMILGHRGAEESCPIVFLVKLARFW